VRLVNADGASTVYDKGTLLVYDADGSLLRQRSLIPVAWSCKTATRLLVFDQSRRGRGDCCPIVTEIDRYESSLVKPR